MPNSPVSWTARNMVEIHGKEIALQWANSHKKYMANFPDQVIYWENVIKHIEASKEE